MCEIKINVNPHEDQPRLATAAAEHQTVAYPELVSKGVSKSRNFKWLVKVGASKGVTPLI